MMKNSVVLAITASTLAASYPVPASTSAMQPQEHQRQHAQPEDARPLQERCEAMSEMRERMMSRTREADARLSELAGQMDNVSGEAKIEVIAALLSELVVQRQATRESMMAMHQRMMAHMMEHMGAAMPDSQRDATGQSMKTCPMMKAMRAHGETSDGNHEQDGTADDPHDEHGSAQDDG